MKTITRERRQAGTGTLAEESCCPVFDPAPWDHMTHKWKDKLFIKDSVPEVFHIPLPTTYNRTITRMWKDASDANAIPDDKDFMLLAYDPSPFKGELYMHVTQVVPGREHVRISGDFVSKVFDGPYNQVPEYIEEMDGYLASMGKAAKKHYFYFTTCPKCAKKYGHNYIVDLAQV